MCLMPKFMEIFDEISPQINLLEKRIKCSSISTDKTNSTFTIKVIKIYFRWATEHHRLLLHCFNGHLWIWRNFVYSFNFEGVRMKSIITKGFYSHKKHVFSIWQSHDFLIFFSFFGVIVNWNSLIYQKVREQPIRIQRVK